MADTYKDNKRYCTTTGSTGVGQSMPKRSDRERFSTLGLHSPNDSEHLTSTRRFGGEAIELHVRATILGLRMSLGYIVGDIYLNTTSSRVTARRIDIPAMSLLKSTS